MFMLRELAGLSTEGRKSRGGTRDMSD
jgi:hypothetical protein